MPTSTNEETPVAVVHPDWCDPTACTATTAVAKGESHRASPTTVSVWSLYDTLEITAQLSQAHCRWSTDVYVDLDVRGLYDNYQATGGRAAFPVENLTKLVGMLADLAATGKAWRDRQVAEELAAVGLRAPVTAEPAGANTTGEGVDR